ncbi:MAG: DUF4139 domain-containing protein [Anaerolineae bacterium]|nr:DUF4139 domain-containing protein [Anaerolineae bacterium]
MRRRAVLTIFLVLAVGLSGAAGYRSLPQAVVAQEPGDQAAGPEIAVYNQGVALVKDTRTLDLEQGVQSVTITDVAEQLDPTSVHFRSLSDPEGTVVLEQNFEYDLVGPERLLSKYVDQRIEVITQDGTVHQGTLLSGAGDLILRDDQDRVVVIRRDSVRDFTFPALPEGLITRPSLVWLVNSAQGGTQDVEIAYLTGGISWQANYVVLLAQDSASLDLDGWVTLNNNSGATYTDARLKLVAGDINRVTPAAMDRGLVMEEYALAAPAAAPQVEQRGFFEYHLYEVLRPVTIRDRQQKQVEFVTATGVPAEKFFVYDGAPGYAFWGGLVSDPSYGADTGVKQVRTMLAFQTGEEGVDAQLPRGVIRVYQEDVDGSPLPLGEDRVDHTPKGEEVRLYIGDAFDIVGERVQTDFQKLGSRAMEESYRITLRNHKEEAVEVRVVEHMFRWSEWQIVRETAEHTKLDAQQVEWRVQVPADGESVIEYTVRYEW